MPDLPGQSVSPCQGFNWSAAIPPRALPWARLVLTFQAASNADLGPFTAEGRTSPPRAAVPHFLLAILTFLLYGVL